MEIQYYSTEDLSKLPDQPGIYKYYNAEKILIYVGKAKSLKKRVSSYFGASANINRKTRRMVSEIKHIEFTIVNSELDALHLENSLIKENQPKYNILLKDDKTYPYILITNERFPRIFSTRRVNHNNGQYFGPFASVSAMNTVLKLIRQLYTLRTCKLNLSQENILAGKFKVCLEYHIKNCQGPCENLQTEENYLNDINQAKEILKGNLRVVKEYFKQNMTRCAELLEFEKAAFFKYKLEMIDKFQAKTLVVNQNLIDIDVFTITSDEKKAFINYLYINNGTVVSTQTVEVKKKLDEADDAILLLVMVDLRRKLNSKSKNIITNIELGETIDEATITVPKIGDKRKLIELSLKNALYYRKEKLGETEEKNENRVVKQLQSDLRLQHPPNHIECFDNSNMQGTNPVASMVCFMNGKPAKKEYRHYNIKTVVGPDDFASMEEITYRRYSRLLHEEKPLPQLIVIDGGKGQLNAACSSLKKLELYGKIPIIGIAKRLEEIYFPDDQYPIHLEKKSESLRLIQRLRDEAHRFAITFHRKKRSNGAINTALADIDGIGKSTAEKLFKQFKSVKKIKEATLEEIEAVIGPAKAKLVIEGLEK